MRFLALSMFIAFSVYTCAAEEAKKEDFVPCVVKTSHSGFGPFNELSNIEYDSSGLLKWIGEAHVLRMNVAIEANEKYVVEIRFPNHFSLTHVGTHPRRSYRLRSKDQDLDWWGNVQRDEGRAKISVNPHKCCRKVDLSLGFHERGCDFFGAIKEEQKPRKTFIVDENAKGYNFEQDVWKTMSVRPCESPLEAAHVAEDICFKHFRKNMYSERPWRVTDSNECYLITGSLPPGHLGGVAQLKIRKSDGFVWLYYHGK